MSTKKITPKKRTPNPVVVLEEWQSPTWKSDRCRVIYDAERDKIVGQAMMGLWKNPIWEDDIVVPSEWRAMP